MHHAAAYYHSYTTPLEFNMSAADTYYNIVGYDILQSYGVIVNETGAIVQKKAYYDISASMSFSGGNSGEYEVELFVNGVGQEECVFFRSTQSSAIGSASFRCHKNLDVGDVLMVKVKDITTPVQDIRVYQLNFNMIEMV